MYKMTIPQDKIGAPHRSRRQEHPAIIEETKATVDVEEDGTVLIGSSDEARRAALMTLLRA
jgi:polyribonucleotide nucleotidyltransferase